MYFSFFYFSRSRTRIAAEDVSVSKETLHVCVGTYVNFFFRYGTRLAAEDV